jgi:hypothetical protein
MNTSRIFLIALCLLAQAGLAQKNKLDIVTSEPIKIFHGAEPVVEYENRERTRDFEVLSAEGATVTVRIKNPNYLLYQYSTNVKEVQIKDDLPDISELVLALNALPVQRVARAAVAPTCLGDLSDLSEALKDLQEQMDEARKIIAESDDEARPLSIFLTEVEQLPAAKYNFNDPALEANLVSLVKESVTGTSAEEKFISLAMQGKMKEIAKEVSDLKAMLITSQSFSYKFRTGKKVYTIAIIAQAKKGVRAHRAVDTLAKITVHPYVVSSWEMIPTLNFVYASGGKEFGVENGLITERDMDEVTPRYGVFLVRNLWNWGRFNEVRCGLGVGFALRAQQDQKILENLHAGFFANIRDRVRLGLGVGFAQVPTGINQSAVGEALPADVKSIDDITTYSRRPAAFLSITIFGFKFPNQQ